MAFWLAWLCCFQFLLLCCSCCFLAPSHSLLFGLCCFVASTRSLLLGFVALWLLEATKQQEPKSNGLYKPKSNASHKATSHDMSCFLAVAFLLVCLSHPGSNIASFITQIMRSLPFVWLENIVLRKQPGKVHIISHKHNWVR